MRAYRMPLAVGGLLLVVLVGWAHRSWRDIELGHRHHTCSFATQLFAFLTAEREGRKGSVLSPDATKQALGYILRVSPPLLFAQYRLGDKVVAQVGDVPDALVISGASGEWDDREVQVLWRPLLPLAPSPRHDRAHHHKHPHKGPDHRKGHHRGPPPGGPPPGSPDRRGHPPGAPLCVPIPASTSKVRAQEAPTVVLGLRLRPPPHSMRRGVMEVLGKSLVGLLACLALVVAWVQHTRRRLLDAALAAEQLKRSHYEDLSLAAAGLAHETKNPLGIIMGLAQRIGQASTTPEKTEEMADFIIDEAERAAVRLGEFMSYARWREPQREAIALASFVGRLHSILETDFAAASISLACEVVPPDATLEADPEMLNQILTNLLLNALQASAAGGEVVLQFARREGQGHFVVRDRGKGIEAARLADIFKPYVTGREGGHGLGLALVKRMVEQHTWSIAVKSQPGEGTTMTITL